MNVESSGEFARLMKLTVELGMKLQERCGDELVARYSQMDHPRPKIAEWVIEQGYNEGIESPQVVSNAVGFALRGNHDERHNHLYRGLIDEERLKEIAKKHIKDGSQRGTLVSKAEKKGIHSLNHEQLADAARKGAIANGRLPIDEGERVFILLAYHDSLSCAGIARALNEGFHDGKCIRSRNSVYSIVKTTRRDYPNYFKDFI